MPIAIKSGSGINRSTDGIYILNSYIRETNKEDAIMKEGMKIKVIKRGQAKAPVKTVTKSKRASAREVVSNVSSWVTDLQARKREETKVAIERFFNQGPRPSEL